ncbi:hypothetical protein Ami103574_04975 [Aminipila butyrica]|uniref:Hemerythrin-like domain-containing protein n=1 Tax=Aminipila butyrica TaxID=433296 RepID=A0A858BTN8_9FIRM|nr:hypothetical protein [Aminipila butyrica]QIB68712.1 hypothetical protein Ami103574_04975 [Aminipila butyrica]
MDYRQGIEAKVGLLFQIADQYLSAQISLEQAKDLIRVEMGHIRPAQYEGMKKELAKRLQESGGRSNPGKLFELFQNYLTPPFQKLPKGHPLRIYLAENVCVRGYLVQMDELEEEGASLEDWVALYETLSHFAVHIKRQEKNFYALCTSSEIYSQAQTAEDLGRAVLEELEKNRERLINENIFDFLYYQRTLSQMLMRYLDLEERVLYPEVLLRLTEEDFAALRRLDDQEGYAYIPHPEEFVPQAPEPGAALEARATADVILRSVLAAKELKIIFYNLSGKAVFSEGGSLAAKEKQLPKAVRQDLLKDSCRQQKHCIKEAEETLLVTYSAVRDDRGTRLGFLMIKERLEGVNNEKEQGDIDSKKLLGG